MMTLSWLGQNWNRIQDLLAHTGSALGHAIHISQWNNSKWDTSRDLKSMCPFLFFLQSLLLLREQA